MANETIYEVTWLRRSDDAWIGEKTHGLTFQGACKYGLDRCNMNLQLIRIELIQAFNPELIESDPG